MFNEFLNNILKIIWSIIVLVLQHNIQSPQNEPGFPEWSIPSFMNCSCPHPCSFVGYTTEIRNFAKYNNIKLAKMAT